MLFKLSPVKTHTNTSLFDTLTQHYRTTYSIYWIYINIIKYEPSHTEHVGVITIVKVSVVVMIWVCD